MRRSHIRFLLRLLVFMLPYTVLAVLGIIWVAQNHVAIPFACSVAILSIVGWLFTRWLDNRPAAAPAISPPSTSWPSVGQEAWARVDEIARRVEDSPPPIQDLAAWQDLGLEVLEAAARPFNADSSHPSAAITVPDALKLGEVILRDLRIYVDENVPFADRIKLDLIASALNAKQRYAGGTSWGTIFRGVNAASSLGYWGLRLKTNLVGALSSGLQQMAVGSSTTNLTAPLVGMIAAKFVRITGKYAIDLYSGQLDLAQDVKAVAQSKPLQILLLGQTKAGKSSLVNALFGKPRAATDILPCTDKIKPYAIEKPGLPSIYLFDSVGFGGSDDKQALQLLEGKLSACDLVLVVCSATSAAREADRKLLDQARLKLTGATKRSLPPIIVALTHVDTIRPISEWKPPYDFEHGQRPKEMNVRAACAVVATDLQVPPDDVVPVCTHPDRAFNIDEALTAKVVQALPEADQAKLLRILQETMTADDWEKRKRQLTNLGINATGVLLAGAAIAQDFRIPAGDG